MTGMGIAARTRRHPRSADDRGSMAILLMVVLVGLALGALLVPMVVMQAQTTRFDSTRAEALNRAQSGIDVALGLVGASVTDGIGDSTKLPCAVSGPLIKEGVFEYLVDIKYFLLDPTTDPPSKNQSDPAKISCPAEQGTVDSSGAPTTPRFALFTSTGTVVDPTNGSTTERRLTSTYVFHTSDADILGGIIPIRPPTGPSSLCLDAGSPNPLAEKVIELQPCNANVSPPAQQVFGYRTNLTLQLLSSVTVSNVNGLCLSSTASAKADDNAIRLVRCEPLGAPTPFTQQWSYNVNGKFEAVGKDSTTTGQLSNKCMDVLAQVEDQPVSLGACDSADPWSPSSSVGPGAAAVLQLGDGSSQLVNYHEFSRCLNVDELKSHNHYLIDVPCTQNLFVGALTPDELFLGPLIPAGQASGTGPISTNDHANCLTSLGIVGSQVTLVDCKSGATAQNWTVYGGDRSLNNSTRYTLVSGSLCLGLSAPVADPSAPPIVQMQTCNGAAEQKWNAIPNLLNSTLINTREN